MKTLRCSAALIMLFVSLAAFAQTDFSGSWQINESKSNFGTQPATSMFRKLDVRQTADSLFVTGTRFPAADGSSSSTSNVYPLNGTSMVSVQPNKRTMSARVEWDSEKKTLIRNSIYSAPDQPQQIEYESKETWMLSEDKKSLTLERVFTFRGGAKNSVKVVYEKN